MLGLVQCTCPPPLPPRNSITLYSENSNDSPVVPLTSNSVSPILIPLFLGQDRYVR
jgi:hypothetical protein